MIVLVSVTLVLAFVIAAQLSARKTRRNGRELLP